MFKRKKNEYNYAIEAPKDIEVAMAWTPPSGVVVTTENNGYYYIDSTYVEVLDHIEECLTSTAAFDSKFICLELADGFSGQEAVTLKLDSITAVIKVETK